MMSMQLSIATGLVLILAKLHLCMADDCTMVADVQYAQHTGTWMYRSEAADGRSVLLKRNQYIEIPFTIHSMCTISVQKVSYSNDGARDRIDAYIDGNYVAGFWSRAESKHGALWNTFLSSGFVGKESKVSAGGHTLKLIVAHADVYGVELNQVWLSLDCEQHCMRSPKTTYTHHCVGKFEAQQGRFTGKEMIRTNASSNRTVLLHKDKYVESVFRMDSECLLEVQNVVYSNDGKADTISVYVDGNKIGSFLTYAEAGHGKLWNVMRNSSSIGMETHISPGLNHRVKLVATLADKYGVEIDCMKLSVKCAKKRCPIEVD